MVPNSSTFAWKIPWAAEPGGLQSMGPQRDRNDWATEHTIKYVVVSHCCTLQFLDDIWCRTCFHMLICHLYLFGELSVENFCSFLNWIGHFFIVEFCELFAIKILAIFFIRYLSANIFSQSVPFLLILWQMPWEQKFYILMKFNLIISFMDYAFSSIWKS